MSLAQNPLCDRQDGPPLLQLRGISKTFSGVRVLKDVSLEAHGGEILALMGENGAGKSTLMKILSGAYTADPGGEVRIAGQIEKITNPASARALGIGIIYQELALAPNLTVAENIHLGSELRRNGMIDRAAMSEACRALLLELGAPFGPDDRLSAMSVAEQQLVEIARALHRDARILVLDEPTTALSARETERLFLLIRKLRARGLALIYISHRMDEIDELADRVSVLRDGAHVGTLEKDELSSARIVSMMVGRDLSSFYEKDGSHVRADLPPVLQVEGLTDGRRVQPASFVLQPGEVLGIAGLVGAGRTELARLIFGADPRTGGTVRLGERVLDIRSPRDALAEGIAYLTEDRKALGLFLDMSCSGNINLGVVETDARLGVLDRARGKQRATGSFAALRIKAQTLLTTVGGLSGGNQQKVLLGRLLETGPRVLILDEPTRGVDIGAKTEIYRIINDLAAKGLGILVISSEMAEIIGVSDRVIVMREGQLTGELTGSAITQEAIMSLAVGLAAAPSPLAA
ncbi:sugar ABC transporter ATP-binding protein [Swaminathania salitolerans]|uniref:Ribose import ATP-binding protein RbsA n=1 Tax=Swaminathania salitolerans TaxID=182838 RepID=A0A511BPD7_9PROT|nr:sugar ABC transporter ATP-binding protein [Swaminathania salitolerans]GEL02190.1 ribose import ATP-binding protein RbsA [Swaminathania salitolerans]